MCVWERQRETSHIRTNNVRAGEKDYNFNASSTILFASLFRLNVKIKAGILSRRVVNFATAEAAIKYLQSDTSQQDRVP